MVYQIKGSRMLGFTSLSTIPISSIPDIDYILVYDFTIGEAWILNCNTNIWMINCNANIWPLISCSSNTWVL